MSPSNHDEALEALANELAGSVREEDPTPTITHQSIYDRGYKPPLNPVQLQGYDSQAKFILEYGERGSGKTIGGLHKLVDHCYNNARALAIIIVCVKRQAEEGGAWDKLQSEVLPQWKADLGAGFVYTDPKTNTAKDVFIWVRNRFDKWSRVLLLSMPVDSFVADRIKGIEPSFVLVDEAQTLESDVYFRALIQQIGRRKGIVTKQQVVYCCNPAGPSHWLYNRFFIQPVNSETGAWDPNYAVFHVPISENKHNLPTDYWENVLEAVRGDDIEKRRMVDGEWIDRAAGDAVFRESFNENLHVKGEAGRNIGLLPVKGYTVFVGYDPGAAHSSIHFLQCIPTKEKVYWLIFDEINCVGQYVPYFKLVPRILKRMDYWNERMATKFQYRHVSDSSAFNQYRAKEGSYDAWDIEKLSQDEKGDPRIRLLECPKGPHSIEARVRMVSEMLLKDEILLSATCTATKDMFMKLEEDPETRLKPKRGKFMHPFDSMSYPMFYVNHKGQAQYLITETAAVKPQSYVIGG